MRKLRFMAEEFFRSFRMSLFKNLLLMVVFAISIVMVVIMGSYYFDLGDRYSDSVKKIGNQTWYDMTIFGEEKSMAEFEDAFTAATGCYDMMDYEKALRTSQDYPILSFSEGGVDVRDEEMDRFFGEKSNKDFLDVDLDGERYESIPVMIDGQTYLTSRYKSIQMDAASFRFFGLRVQEGEELHEDHLILEHISDPVPIVVGSQYRGIVEPGDVLNVTFGWYTYPCRVAGILEEGSEMPSEFCYGDGKGSLDHSIVFPYGVRVADRSGTVEELKKYAELALTGLDNGITLVPDGKLRQRVESIKSVARQYHLPPIEVFGTSMGMSFLSKESATTVVIMLVLTVTLACFALYGLFVTFYDKIQSNSRIYGIYLMNGCSLSMILIPLLLEVAVILVPAFVTGAYLFNVGSSKYQPEVILSAARLVVGVVFVIGAGAVTFFLRGVDTEHLVRQKD